MTQNNVAFANAAAAIQRPPPQPYDPLDASLIAMMIRSKVDVP